MSEYTLSVRLTGDAGDLVGEVKLSEQAFERLERSTKDNAQASRQAAQSTDRLTQSQSRNAGEARKLNSLYKTLGGTLAVTAAGFLSIQSATRFVEDFKKQEQATAALDASLASMGRTTIGLSEQLQALASQIQSEGIIGDEAIIQGQSFLTTYSQISDELLPRATRLMADLAAKMGGDVVSAANMVGKASMGMTGELARAGITFSDAAKESKDFSLILQEMEAQVGGMNRALAETGTGGFDQFGNSLGDLRENLGEIITIGSADYFRNLASEMAISQETIQSWGDTLHTTIGYMDEAALAVAALLAARTLGPVFNSAAVAVNTYTAAQIRATLAMRTGMAVGRAYMGVMAALGGPAGLIIAGASALAIWASNSSDAAAETENYAEKLAQLEGNLEKVELAQLKASITRAESDRQALEAQLKGTSGREYAGLFQQLGNLNSYLNAAKSRAHELASALKETGSAAGKAGDDIGGAGDDVKGAAEQLDKYVASLREQYATLGMTEKQLLQYNTAQVIAGQESSDAAKEAEKLTRQILKKKAALEAEAKQQEKSNEQAEEAVKTQKALESAYAKEIMALAEQQIKLTSSEREYYRYTLTVRGFESAQIDAALAIWDNNQALQAQADATIAAGEAAERAAEQMHREQENIATSLTDALLRGFEDGADFAANFVETLKNMFRTLVLRPIIQPIATGMAGGITGALMPGSASAGTGGGGFSLSNISSMFGGNSFASTLNGIAGGLGFGTPAGAAASAGVMPVAGGMSNAPAGIFGGSNLAIGGAGLIGGFLADALFGGKNSGTFGGLGSSLGYSLAAGSAASGGMMAGLGAAAGPVGAIAGMVIGGLLGKIGGKPSDKTQWSGFTGSDNTLFVGGESGKKFSQENRDAATQMAQALQTFNAGLGQFAELSDSYQVFVGGRDGILIQASELGSADQLGHTPNGSATLENTIDIYRGASAEDALEAATNRIWDKFLSTTESFSESMLTLMGGLTDPDERLASATSFGAIQAYLDADPVADYAAAVELANRTLWDASQVQYNGLMDLASAYDGSVAATQELAAATQARYQIELALLAQIDAAVANTDKLFSASREQFELAGLNNEETYNYWKTRADNDAAELATLIDPARIEQQINDIAREYRAAWSVLNDQQQAAKAPEYLAYIDELEALRDERLNAARERIDDESATIARETNQAIAAAAERFVEAAQRIEEAATAISAAAGTPVPVTVSLTGLPQFDALFNDVGGA